MFDPKAVAKFAKDNETRLKNLAKVEETLLGRFYNLQNPIRALILAVASGEPLLLIGPPGTGKSRLIRAFCAAIGLLNEANLGEPHPDYFEYLLTPFTEPGELFGYYDISLAQQGKLQRIENNMMQKARVVYLDEVFNGSSAILNSILAFLNERIFHDRGEIKPVRMDCLFAATNQVPERPELRAIFDRFVLRCQVENVDHKSEEVGRMLASAWAETYTLRTPNRPGSTDLLVQMDELRRSIQAQTQSAALKPDPNKGTYVREITRMIEQARRYELSAMSNRRLVKMLHLMLIHRAYEAVRGDGIGNELHLRKEELMLIPRFFLDFTADEAAVRQLEGIASGAKL